MTTMMKRFLFIWCIVIIIVGVWLVGWPGRAIAQDEPTFPSDQACRLCHSDTTAEIVFPSSETLSVQVNLNELQESAHGVHGDQPLPCTACHDATHYQFPHRPVSAPDLATYQQDQATTCEQCHQQPHLTSHPAGDDPQAVSCTDCHGSHQVAPAGSWQSGQDSNTCVNCHQQEGVPAGDAQTLTTTIQNGLFTKQIDNAYCLACHSQPNRTMTLANGDTLSLTIEAQTLHDSVHGAGNEWQPLACTDCHENHQYPHAEITAGTARAYSLDMYPICAECHQTNYDNSLDSVHATALEEGNEEAAVCTDCHGAHDTPTPNEPRQRISYTCRQCHSTIFDDYAQSVHGTALLEESNQDVPTCIECHGVHNIGDPTTNLFRLRSPELCADCHANSELMSEYDISTEVFDTYVADFHGTTVTLFEHQDPNLDTNKAVCYDCHGVHKILSPDDPESGIKANLLATCQQCHPDATANFPNSWTSHFRPSLQHNPLVFIVNSFYQVVIPATVGFFGFLVATDVYRRLRIRFTRSGL